MVYAATVTPIAVEQRNAFALRAPCYVENIVLLAGAKQDYTIPTAAVGGVPNYAVFSANGDFWASYVGGTGSQVFNTAAAAALPVASSSTGQGSELNPTIRYIGGVNSAGNREIAKISMIAPVDTLVSIALYT